MSEGAADLPAPQPDAVRAAARAEERAIDADLAMRCGQRIPPQSTWTTNHVEAHVISHYQGQHGGQHTWKYVLSFRNTGRDVVQMLSRHWLFVDMHGHEHEMKGPGARGVTPVLGPGESWSYESGTSLATSAGSMWGSFQFETLKAARKPSASSASSTRTTAPDGSAAAAAAPVTSFDVRIARLALSADGLPENAPCAEEPPEVLLPDTSVRSTRRVIIGVSSRYIEQLSAPADKVWRFVYDVQINNARDSPITVVGHRWHVQPETGPSRVVEEGDGVGGRAGGRELPLPPGEATRVQGVLESPSPRAVASGHYVVRVGGIEGELVHVAIGELALAVDGGRVPRFKDAK